MRNFFKETSGDKPSIGKLGICGGADATEIDAEEMAHS
jgi:hypothetical protein